MCDLSRNFRRSDGRSSCVPSLVVAGIRNNAPLRGWLSSSSVPNAKNFLRQVRSMPQAEKQKAMHSGKRSVRRRRRPRSRQFQRRSNKSFSSDDLLRAGIVIIALTAVLVVLGIWAYRAIGDQRRLKEHVQMLAP